MAKKILVVEDNLDSRSILVTILRFMGYETIEAKDGSQAVEKGIAEQPDLIFMDIGLPGMTGIEAARALKENPASAGIPIVAHTAWDPAQWKDRALEVGMVEYLVKPVPTAILKATVEKFAKLDP